MNAYEYNMKLPSAEYTNIVDHCPGFFLQSNAMRPAHVTSMNITDMSLASNIG